MTTGKVVLITVLTILALVLIAVLWRRYNSPAAKAQRAIKDLQEEVVNLTNKIGSRPNTMEEGFDQAVWDAMIAAAVKKRDEIITELRNRLSCNIVTETGFCLA
jgi:predicted nucleic acid-binding protein